MKKYNKYQSLTLEPDTLLIIDCPENSVLRYIYTVNGKTIKIECIEK